MRNILIALAAGGLFASTGVSAAEFRFVPDRIPVGQTSTVDLWLFTSGETANALEGTLTVPAGLQAAVGTGGSGVPLWLERPSLRGNDLRFAGIIPGGTDAERILVFSLHLSAGNEGVFSFPLREARVLRHDSEGSSLPVGPDALPLRAEAGALPRSAVADLDPPAPFTPEVARDPSVYENRYFVAFSTTDQESGIDHYEVMEIPRGGALHPWRTAESPYLLADQSLGSDIHVRAVDSAGNFVIASLEASRPDKFNQQALYGLIALGLILLVISSRVAQKWKRQRASGE